MKNVVYNEIYQNELSHAWYSATRNLLVRFLKTQLNPDSKILDAGCGTGGTMQILKDAGFNNIYGIDNSRNALNYCHKRGLKNVKLASINALPFKAGSFDAVICLDVLYHKLVKPPQAAAEIFRVLKPEGVAYFQEPAFDFLKGHHDLYIETGRRFTKRQLIKLAEEAGFQIIKCSYFNFFLFLPILVKRLLQRALIKKSSGSDVKPLPWVVNLFAKIILNLEGSVLARFNFPFGLSIICFAKK